MKHPSISTVIVSRPAEPMLARAVLSALCQQGPPSEVVLVLDGRCAHNRRSISIFDDARLRVFEHESAQGRGAARARAVEEARGEWIANVDADDWIYSDKQLVQWNFLQENPEIDLVSGGLLITNRSGALEGVRATAMRGVGLQRGDLPPLPTPSLMIRASVAKNVSYNRQRRAGEDRDFLYRALPNRAWAALPDAGYVYDEYASHSLERCLLSYRRRVSMDVQYRGAHKVAGSAVRNGAKAVVATLIFAAGQGDALVERRSSPPNAQMRARYAQELSLLEHAGRKVMRRPL